MKVLIVEDNIGDFEYISELLNIQFGKNCIVQNSISLGEAKQLVKTSAFDLILLDLGLSDSSGVKTAEEMVQSSKGIPVIVLTGLGSEDVGLQSIKKGAQDFLDKNDLDDKILGKSIKYSLERKKHLDDLKKTEQKISYLLDYTSDGVCVVDYGLEIQETNSSFRKLLNIEQDNIEGSDISTTVPDFKKPTFSSKLSEAIETGNQQTFECNYDCGQDIWYEIKLDPYPGGVIIFVRDVSERVSEKKTLDQLNKSLRKSTDSTINLLAELVELKEPYTAGHQLRVSRLCELIADYMGLPDSIKKSAVLSAKIHDIGKTAIPSEILVKPTSLTQNEMSLVRYHVVSGHNLVKKIDSDIKLSEIILQHHERNDGSGYPNGLKEDEIMPEAKLLAVADVVDAMLSHRPYRSALEIDDVIKELEKSRAVLYDKDIVDACINILRQNLFSYI